MKTIYTLVFALATLTAVAQENRNNQTLPPVATPLYTSDVIIQNDTVDQQKVRLAVAFNGWLYSAFNTEDAASNKGGITIRKSIDNGITWTTLDSYFTTGYRYPDFDIVVAGADTNNLTIYLAGINYNQSSGNYILFVDRYNATTGAFVGSNYNLAAGTNKLYDVALASDYLFPAVGATPYSVGMLYSRFGSSQDSIVYVGSTDGGTTWAHRHTVAVTGFYFGKLSIAYGRSSSGSNGRYFGAWERRPSAAARTGNIYSSRSSSTVDGAWINPVNLDSVSSAAIGLCKNPQIASSFGTGDNDSLSVTTVVLVQRDYTGNGSDYDAIGFYNKRSHFTNFWYRLDVVNSNENDLQPDVTYDPANQNFLATYYDSTNGKLPYVVNNFNLPNPNTWITVSAQYNDATNNLKAPYPRVEINPVAVQAAHAWIAQNGTEGVAMFDAEYNITSVNETDAALSLNNIYPNPASTFITIPYINETSELATISVYNQLGQRVISEQGGQTKAGITTRTLNVEQLEAGVYFCRIDAGNKTITRSFVIAR
jgi:hypothetical protein